MAKILIVDDSDTLRIQLKNLLHESNHEVLEGSHGLDGLGKAQANRDLDLVICDFNMPEMDGITMSKKVREIPGLQDVPIFMLTTESTAELKSLGKEAGIMAWIVKPYNAEKLKVVVEKVLQMPRTGKGG